MPGKSHYGQRNRSQLKDLRRLERKSLFGHNKTMSNASNWFTVETMDSATFAISEYGHWTQIHSYLFVGNERAALIDTGLGIANIKEIVLQLTQLPVLVITTHVHADHIGGHSLFTEIAVHENDKSWLEHGIPIPIEQIRKYITKKPFIRGEDTSFL